MTNLIFIHIPKTGGSTFHSIINKRYDSSEIYNVFGSKQNDEEIKNFIELPVYKKERIKLLKGHMPFGLHSYLNDRFSYITFLRNPVDRVISQYYYIKKNKNNPNHEIVEGDAMSISDFVESGIVTGMNNGQARFITGDVNRLPYGDDTNLLSDAKENINRYFRWVGVTERFDESMISLWNILEWDKKPYYIKQNVSKVRKSLSEIDEKDLRVVKNYNSVDEKLYEYANQLLDESLSNIKDCDKILESYKKHNEKISNRWSWLPEKYQRFFI